MTVVAQLGVKQLRRWTPAAYLVGCLLLLAVDLVGIGAKGAQRWLEIPGLPRFQPSEIMKLVVPLAVSSFLAASVLPPRLVHVMVTIAIVAVPTVLVLIQPDLGTAVLIADLVEGRRPTIEVDAFAPNRAAQPPTKDSVSALLARARAED